MEQEDQPEPSVKALGSSDGKSTKPRRVRYGRRRFVAKAARRSKRSSQRSDCKINCQGQGIMCLFKCGEDYHLLLFPLLLVCSGCLLCCCSCFVTWKLSFTSCMFCEVKIKKKLYEEHRQNCFTENLDKIKGFKEASLPKECPNDESHVLYQWPERKSETLNLNI